MNDIYIRTMNNGRVTFVHFNPFDPKDGMNRSRETLEKEGYFIPVYPDPEEREGFNAIPYYNKETKSIYYEYQPKELSPKEMVDNLQANIASIIANTLASMRNKGEI